MGFERQALSLEITRFMLQLEGDVRGPVAVAKLIAAAAAGTAAGTGDRGGAR